MRSLSYEQVFGDDNMARVNAADESTIDDVLADLKSELYTMLEHELDYTKPLYGEPAFEAVSCAITHLKIVLLTDNDEIIGLSFNDAIEASCILDIVMNNPPKDDRGMTRFVLSKFSKKLAAINKGHEKKHIYDLISGKKDSDYPKWVYQVIIGKDKLWLLKEALYYQLLYISEEREHFFYYSKEELAQKKRTGKPENADKKCLWTYLYLARKLGIVNEDDFYNLFWETEDEQYKSKSNFRKTTSWTQKGNPDVCGPIEKFLQKPAYKILAAQLNRTSSSNV